MAGKGGFSTGERRAMGIDHFASVPSQLYCVMSTDRPLFHRATTTSGSLKPWNPVTSLIPSPFSRCINDLEELNETRARVGTCIHCVIQVFLDGINGNGNLGLPFNSKKRMDWWILCPPRGTGFFFVRLLYLETIINLCQKKNRIVLLELKIDLWYCK